MFRMCCCEKKFKSIAFITPFYGIICNIINTILLAKNDDIQYGNSLVFSVVSLFFSLISLALTYALKVIEQKIYESQSNLSEVNREPNSQRDYPTQNGKNANYKNILHSPSDSYVIRFNGKKKK